jgi:sulfofructose kinase
MFDAIVGLGLCVVDELLVVDGSPPDATRTRYRERVVSPGGMVATALAQAAQLGCPSQLISAVGDDRDGRFLLRELRALGVGTRRVVRGPECPTTRAIVLVNAANGERRFLVPDRRALERRAPDFDLAPIRAGRILLVDGHYPAQALRALRRARETGALVVADFSDSRPAYHRMLPFVDYPIVSEEFGRSWGVGGARETLHALRDEYGGLPVVTEGHRGALALVDGRVRRIAAARARVRDTTGAGDAFHGAFAAGLYYGQKPLAALSLAARAAARSCTAVGGPAGLMCLKDVPGGARGLTARGNRSP